MGLAGCLYVPLSAVWAGLCGDPAPWDLSNSQLTVEEKGGVLLYPLALGPEASGIIRLQWTHDFRENLESHGLSLFSKTDPSELSLGPKTEAILVSPGPSPRLPAPPPPALPPASPREPGALFLPG